MSSPFSVNLIISLLGRQTIGKSVDSSQPESTQTLSGQSADLTLILPFFISMTLIFPLVSTSKELFFSVERFNVFMTFQLLTISTLFDSDGLET